MTTSRGLAAQQAADDTVGAGEWVGAGVALVVAVALAWLARWAIRRVGHRGDTVTATVQVMARCRTSRRTTSPAS